VGEYSSILALLDYLIRARQHIGRNSETDLFAAFRLMISSNFVGCSTGKSAGLVPLKILST
jgi:hypothetical protein